MSKRDDVLLVHTYVAGVKYRSGGEREVAASLQNNDPLILVPEPGNEHDPMALQVRTAKGGVFVGYVPKGISGAPVRLLDGGYNLKAHAWRSRRGELEVCIYLLADK